MIYKVNFIRLSLFYKEHKTNIYLLYNLYKVNSYFLTLISGSKIVLVVLFQTYIKKYFLKPTHLNYHFKTNIAFSKSTVSESNISYFHYKVVFFYVNKLIMFSFTIAFTLKANCNKKY